MPHLGKEIFLFGGFCADAGERSLTYGAASVRITPKVFDVLVCFLRNPGKLVTKQQLLDTVWGDVAVEESALARAVCDLRRVLAQHDPSLYIQTVAKFGYRFVASVEEPGLVEPRSEGPGGAARARGRGGGWGHWAVAAAAGPVLAALALSSWPGRGPQPQVKSIAVLPFYVVGQVKDRDLLEVGLADAVASRLAGAGDLTVRPTSTTLKYRGVPADPRQTAVDLRVDAVLVGVMQVSEERVRVTTQLVRATDGSAIWSGEIETEAGKTLTLEREIAQQVAERLMARAFRPDRGPAAGAADTAMLEPYFRGRGFWMRRDRASLDRAVGEFQKAIAADPAFAPAHAGLADCYLLLGLYNHLPPAEMVPKARAEAELALRLDPKSASAHATLGLITQNWERDWAAAERHYRRSIGIAPNYATARHWYAEFLSVQGRFEESFLQFREAERIDPVSSIIRTDEAQLWYFARNYDRSQAVLSQVLELDPDFEQAHEQMALVYAAQGREAAAWAEASRLSECKDPASVCRLRWTAWLPGRDAAAAAKALRRLESQAAVRYVAPRVLAIACARQGMAKQALQWLRKAAEAREVGVITMKVEPLLDPVRSRPEFPALLRKLQLD